MLIDTGSPVTILSENLIKKVDLGSSGLSRVESTLSAADGNKMKIKGQAVCEIKIGNNEFQHKIIFTKLGKLEGILGMDFLKCYECEIKLAEAKFLIAKQVINLKQHFSTTCARIKLGENRVVSPRSETFLKGYVDGEFSGDFGMIEPNKILFQKRGLLVAKSLNNTKEKRNYYLSDKFK
ncbi:unnamed protein product [Mytilus edulis]|uniref:Peptidase A2 domain-containing protein n=1 Tax=Mytilus edulis TaxID=6550 RepID=A0A8S3UB71_MYTED|nr:unnamed protein product [Mytilus edulis]